MPFMVSIRDCRSPARLTANSIEIRRSARAGTAGNNSAGADSRSQISKENRENCMERVASLGSFKTRSIRFLTFEIPFCGMKAGSLRRMMNSVLCESPRVRHPQEKCASKCVRCSVLSAFICFVTQFRLRKEVI